jgi:hypothetical protein
LFAGLISLHTVSQYARVWAIGSEKFPFTTKHGPKSLPNKSHDARQFEGASEAIVLAGVLK